MALKIMPYNYKTICDTNRCNNMASVSLGNPGHGTFSYHNICNDCLQDILNEAPLEMLLKRDDLQEIIIKTAKDLFEELEKEKKEEKEPEESEGKINYEEYGVRELIVMARERGLSGYTGLSKVNLIKMLEESE